MEKQNFVRSALLLITNLHQSHAPCWLIPLELYFPLQIPASSFDTTFEQLLTKIFYFTSCVCIIARILQFKGMEFGRDRLLCVIINPEARNFGLIISPLKMFMPLVQSLPIDWPKWWVLVLSKRKIISSFMVALNLTFHAGSPHFASIMQRDSKVYTLPAQFLAIFSSDQAAYTWSLDRHSISRSQEPYIAGESKGGQVCTSQRLSPGSLRAFGLPFISISLLCLAKTPRQLPFANLLVTHAGLIVAWRQSL